MQFLKGFLKDILQRPKGVGFGDGSYIPKPYVISGGHKIRVGRNVSIGTNFSAMAVTNYANVEYEPSIEIGDDVYIGNYAYLTAIDRICIGDGCVLSEYVYITDEQHGLTPVGSPIMARPLESKGPVILGPKCFVGFRAAILSGVVLGEGCVVGANSTVTKSFPGFSMIAGSPAKLLKIYSHETCKWVDPETK
jgi:acetyltransferase-like isoleucine patch superfamily enzyme